MEKRWDGLFRFTVFPFRVLAAAKTPGWHQTLDDLPDLVERIRVRKENEIRAAEAARK